jgi:hypothetical protein
MKTLSSNRTFIVIALISQFIPLMAFTPDTYSLTSQVWWLSALLSIMVFIGVLHLLTRGTYALWPWYLMCFSQGFNIIGRIMMFFPHVTQIQNGAQILNIPYIVIGIITMLWSAFLLVFFELPEVRNKMIKD